uniref:Uncharacterized protein n=1 Tax=Macrostomum lignano TaxID=282301 RepID=A0A1I8IKP4_9PLAT
MSTNYLSSDLQQFQLASYEVDSNQACRRGYHLLRIPCEEFHRLVQSQEQEQQEQQEQPIKSQSPDRQSPDPLMIDSLTSCTIRTPPQPPPYLPRRRRSMDRAIYQRMRAILCEAGEPDEDVEEAAAALLSSGGGDRVSFAPDIQEEDEEEEEEEEQSEEAEVDEEESSADDEETLEDEDDEEANEEAEAEDADEACTESIIAAARRGSSSSLMQQRRAVDTRGSSVSDSCGIIEGEMTSTAGYRIFSGDEAATAYTDNEIRAALSFEQTQLLKQQQQQQGTAASQDRTMQAATVEQSTCRSILKNGNGRRCFTAESSELASRPGRTVDADAASASMLTHSTYDSAMSRMRARQSELTRCVLLEQQKERELQAMRSGATAGVAGAGVEPGLEAAMQHRRAALEGIAAAAEATGSDYGDNGDDERRAAVQQQRSNGVGPAAAAEGWDFDVPAALK